MSSARDVVEQYLDAYYRGDFPTARRYLANDLSFAGPGVTFATADDYLRASRHAVRQVKGVETHQVFADGADVGIFYDLRVDHPESSIAMASWYHLEGDTIVSIRTVFDTAPFVAGAGGQQAGETAVDPVCGMAVSKATAAATRHHHGVTYYFCNAGCAEAFEHQPETYLAASR
jgi:YHS domain-containing protein